jgi:hypothetical protein
VLRERPSPRKVAIPMADMAALAKNPRVKILADVHRQSTVPIHPFGSAGSCIAAERTWKGWWEL